MNSSKLTDRLLLVASLGILVASLLTLYYVCDSIRSLTQLVQEMRSDMNESYLSLANISLTINKLRNEINVASENAIYVNVSELLESPEAYEGKMIAVLGEFHNVATIPEIKLPYNAVLADGKYQIGVSTSQSVSEGSSVIVEGLFVKGTIKKLGSSGWVDSGSVWYIEAVRLRRI